MTHNALLQAPGAAVPGRFLLIISASASTNSRSERIADYLGHLLRLDYARVEHLRLRLLPAHGLLEADTAQPEIDHALKLVAGADAIAIVTPTYKATYSGVLKVFLDLLPQYALQGKVVLPLAVGGSPAHMLMLDYALRPVLQTMWPKHVAQGCFLIDQDVSVDENGKTVIGERSLSLLSKVLPEFEQILEPPGAALSGT